MNNKIKIVFRVIIFIIIGLIIMHFLDKIFLPKWVHPIDPATARIKGFYLEEKNSLDTLIIGTSGASRGYSPLTVWEEYGITGYNLGSSYQTMPMAYYKLCEALKYQKPKVFILEMDALHRWSNPSEESKRKLFDNLKLDEVKFKAINDKNLKLNNKLSYIFPIMRFHSRWNELEVNDFKKNMKNEYDKVSFKGFPIIKTIKPYIDKNDYMGEKGEKKEILSEDKEYIDKMVKLCKENNIKMLWVEIPCSHSWSLAMSNAVTELANKYGIEYIDYNLQSNREKIGFDWTKDTYDAGGHTNIYGAEKVSKDIGRVLSEKYNCTSYKNDKNIAQKWNEALKIYNQEKGEKRK